MLVAGFNTTLNSAVAKSIIRTMEMNGSLESSAAGIKAKAGRESAEEDDEEEQEEAAANGIAIRRLRTSHHEA